MKKVYKAPMLYAEEFKLVEHISQGCVYQTNFGNTCPITEGGVTYFTSASACSEDGVSMMEFAGLDPTSASIEDLIGMNIQCYNAFSDFSQLFTS